MKRMLSLLLALVMVLGVLPLAALADEATTKPVAHLTADKTRVQPGEEVTLTLALDGDVSGSVYAWEWDIIYDSAYFTITGSTVGLAAQPKIPDDEDYAIQPVVNTSPMENEVTGTYLYASVFSGTGLTAHYLKEGTIATLTLKAKEEITGDISSKFYFVPINVQGKNGVILDVVDADSATNWGKEDFLAGTMPADTVGLPITIAKAPDPIDITVYYADNGQIVTGKDNTLLNFAPVHVTDKDGDGKLTISDGFACFHDTYHTAGSAGYGEDSERVTKFWSVDGPYASCGRNNGWVSGTTEEIAAGDSLCLFTYQDETGYSDLYTYFDNLTGTAKAKEETNFHVNGISLMQSSQTTAVTAAPQGATVTATCEGQENLTTTVDADGNFSLTFPTAGIWTVLVNGNCNYTPVGGYNETPLTDAPVAPALMTVTVAEGEETDPTPNPDPTPDPDPDPTPDPEPTTNGYTVTLDEKKEVTVGETIAIDVKVGHTDENVTTYNAFDMTFSYNSDVLELTSTEIEGLTVIPGEGTVRVQGYGPDRDINSVAFTLTFKAKKIGETDVTVTTPKVDKAAHAIAADAPEAEKSVGTTDVTISGYRVNLPDAFTGAGVVEPNTDYTFEAKDKNYNYTFDDTTMGGEKAEVVDNGNGTFTIKNVTGEINVVSEMTPKTFAVTLGTDMTGSTEATYKEDYKATLTEEANYSYDVQVTIGGVKYDKAQRDGDTITIPGKDITGVIVFTVTKTYTGGGTTTTYKVTFEGSGMGDATGESTVTSGAKYSFTLTEESGYKYEVAATMGGQEAAYAEEEGTYTFEKVTGDLVITITKTLDVTVKVERFVELDSKTVFLVTANATLGEGKALTYDGTAMFYSDGSDSTEETSTGYNAWCYLVIVEKGDSFTETDAAAKIDAATSKYTTLTATKDVNESTKVDINDAQLVYDIYNSKYLDFNTVSMQKFLNADVNHDRSVTVADAAAVVAAIQ